jgi:hypothetical protein
LKFKLGIALLGLCALAATAVFIARSTGELSEAQRTQLEQDWNELLTWARVESPRDSRGPNLEQCARAWSAARGAGEEGTAEHLRWRELLASGEYSVAGEPYAGVDSMELAQMELESEGLDSLGLERILSLARRLHQEGPLISFMVGTGLTKQALELCRSDAGLIPTGSDLSTPQPGELFSAICRDFSMLPAALYPSGAGDTVPQDAQDPIDERLLHNLRATYIEIASQYFPLRDHPERFGEVPPPEKPGWLFNLRATLFARPEDMRRVMASLLAVDMGSYGNTWARVVSDWNAVLNL